MPELIEPTFQEVLRGAARQLRIKPIELQDLIPLILRAADEIDALEANIRSLRAEKDAAWKNANALQAGYNELDKRLRGLEHATLRELSPQGNV